MTYKEGPPFSQPRIASEAHDPDPFEAVALAISVMRVPAWWAEATKRVRCQLAF